MGGILFATGGAGDCFSFRLLGDPAGTAVEFGVNGAGVDAVLPLLGAESIGLD